VQYLHKNSTDLRFKPPKPFYIYLNVRTRQFTAGCTRQAPNMIMINYVSARTQWWRLFHSASAADVTIFSLSIARRSDESPASNDALISSNDFIKPRVATKVQSASTMESNLYGKTNARKFVYTVKTRQQTDDERLSIHWFHHIIISTETAPTQPSPQKVFLSYVH